MQETQDNSRSSFGMTPEQYAKFRGVSVDAVSAALAAGQLTKALDGSIDPQHPPIGLTPPQYASYRERLGFRGGSRQMVHNALRDGWLVLYVDGTINSSESDARWAECANAHPENAQETPTQPPGATKSDPPMQSPSDKPNYSEERARRERAAADKARMQADRMSGRLIETSDVSRRWATIMQVVRQNVCGLPDRLSASLAGMSDQGEIHALITKECAFVLTSAATEIENLDEEHDNEPIQD